MNNHLRESIALEIRALLKQKREDSDLSMNRVAEKAGLSQQTISYIERDLRDPSLDTLLRVCGALGIDLSELVAEAESNVRGRLDSAG